MAAWFSPEILLHIQPFCTFCLCTYVLYIHVYNTYCYIYICMYSTYICLSATLHMFSIMSWLWHKLDPAVLPLLTSFGGMVAGRAFGRKKKILLQNMTCAGTPRVIPWRGHLRVSLSVGFAQCVPCFFLSLFSAWIMVGVAVVCVACGRLGTMRGGSVVSQTVQPVQAWKNGR